MTQAEQDSVQATVEMSLETVADHIIEMLAAHGVTHVFGYAGAAVIPLVAAIERHPAVRWVLMRNEGAASLAASAFAKLTGQLAVCMASSGPGATNLITGLVDAQTDMAPVLAITGQIQTWRQGRFEFQDIDSAHVLASLVSYSAHCDQPDQVPSALRYCIQRAQLDKSVVHLSIAADVQAYLPRKSDRLFQDRSHMQAPYLHVISTESIEEAAVELSKTASVVIAVGSAARWCGADIESLAMKLGAPIITTFGAKGIIDESHPCALGVLGIFGAPGDAVAQDVVGAAETILCFGLKEPAAFVADSAGMQVRKLIQCASSTAFLSRRFVRSYTLLGPYEVIAAELSSKIQAKSDRSTLDKAIVQRDTFNANWIGSSVVTKPATVHPLSVFASLNERVHEYGTICLDIGDNAVWAAQFLKLAGRQNILASDNLGTMGFALPAGIAAKLARPEGRVLVIAGDGGLQMTIAELGSAVQCGLSLTILVLNNGLLGRIASAQHGAFGATLHNPDFVKVMRAYGGDGVRVNNASDLDSAFEQAIRHEGNPFLIEVKCDPEALAPMSGWHDAFSPVHFS